jgi:hypothetical protein
LNGEVKNGVFTGGGSMLDKLKTDFDEIVKLVKKAPEPLQETAFKIILGAGVD